jgi:hypothetical protein
MTYVHAAIYHHERGRMIVSCAEKTLTDANQKTAHSKSEVDE